MSELVAVFGLAAVVLTVSALTSGIVERTPLSFPIIFLGLGFLIGERGFGLLTLGPEDPALERYRDEGDGMPRVGYGHRTPAREGAPRADQTLRPRRLEKGDPHRTLP